VSIYLLKRDSLNNFQKCIQVFTVWMVPFLGAIGLWLFHRNDDNHSSTKAGSFGGGANDSIGVSSQGD
jgi:hypothetical protein